MLLHHQSVVAEAEEHLAEAVDVAVRATAHTAVRHFFSPLRALITFTRQGKQIGMFFQWKSPLFLQSGVEHLVTQSLLDFSWLVAHESKD